jgi:SRSO17 transposase
MLPRCRTAGEPFVIPTFDVQVSDVEGVMDELQEFQSIFHDCFARSEARAHFLDYMVGQYSPLARKSIEPMALAVEGSSSRSLQRFLSETVWDEEQMRWNYHQLVADELGEPDGVLMFDESGFVKKGKDSAGVARQYCGTGIGHMTVDTCGKQFLLILHMAFKAKKNSAEAPRSSKKSCSGNMALCRI